MEIAFSQRIKERFPLFEIALIELENVDNRGSRALRAERDRIKKIIKTQYKRPDQLSNIRAYNRIFARHGQICPLEEQLKSIVEGQDIPTKSPLVDAVLLAQLKHAILLDVKDADRIEGQLILDEGIEGEQFEQLNGEIVFLTQGDIVVRDAKGPILSWLAGPATRTKVHRDTKRAIIFALPVPGIEKEKLESCLKEAAEFAKIACGAKPGKIEFHSLKGSETKSVIMERLDPWGRADIKDYSALQQQFGIENFKDIIDKIQNPHPLMKRGIIFGHRDFGRILTAIKKKRQWVMMTGLMPSGKFHFGHKMVADQVLYYQSLGAEIFLCIADLEAYGVRKMDMEEIRKIAIDEYLANFIALGLKPKKCHFYFQSNWKPAYYRLSAQLARRVTFNEFKDIYGDISPAKIQAALLQAADILHPQLAEFGGPRPVLVPVGVDQDPHLRLTRDIAARCEFNFILPSSTYHRFMTGLKGGKMSSSVPDSYIALTERPEIAERKLMAALTGGGGSVKEQREKGGRPELCTIFEMFSYHLADDRLTKKVYDECRTGKRICGECKRQCADLLKEFLIGHQKKLEKAKSEIGKFLKFDNYK
jgi:tryptophanyl-tRNA synthetase